jgi:acetyl-CoA acyltransferase
MQARLCRRQKTARANWSRSALQEPLTKKRASAPAELIHYENLGLCAPGDAPKLIRSGDTDLGGRIPVNPSGGLLSQGHPVGATGVAQIVQLTEQLRGTAGPRQRPGAKVARAENNGGQLAGDSAVALATILST